MNKKILQKQYKLIPFSKLKITESDRTTGYDFSVEDYNTFATADGIFVYDTMAIFAPLSEEAQAEAREKMMIVYDSNKLNAVGFKLSNEMLIGIYIATAYEGDNAAITINNFDELYKLHPATNIKIDFRGKKIQSTVGRVLFNNCLPDWFEFVNKPVNKSLINKILDQISKHSIEEYIKAIDDLMIFGFEMATKYPRSISIDILTIPKELYKLKEKLIKEKEVYKQIKIIDEMENKLLEYIKEHNPDMRDFLLSGAAKGIGQLRQIMIAKGLFTDPEGNILPPVASSMTDGYKPEEYFYASSGARKGLISRVKFTSKGGYAYRKMIYVMANVRLSDRLGDCGTRLTAKIKLTDDLFNRMQGRYVQDEYSNKIIPISEDMIGRIISLRSPMFCKSLDICHICYGELYKQINTRHIGLLAAQECTSLSETIMKSFHVGGIASYKYTNVVKLIKNNVDSALEPIIDKYIYQDEFYLKAKDVVMLIIDKNLYKNNSVKITREENRFILPSGYFTLRIAETDIDFFIEQQVTVYYNDSGLASDEEYIIITYHPGDNILACFPEDSSPEKVASNIDKYVGGKTLWKRTEDLFLKMYNTLSIFGDWDTVHLEVIIGNILRWKYDPRLPARVKYPYEPVTYSIKDLPSIISWSLGIAYENINKALTFGILSERGIESPIEKILFGKPVSEGL